MKVMTMTMPLTKLVCFRMLYCALAFFSMM